MISSGCNGELILVKNRLDNRWSSFTIVDAHPVSESSTNKEAKVDGNGLSFVEVSSFNVATLLTGQVNILTLGDGGCQSQ